MTEISGEFSQRNTENLPKPDHTISKFKKLSGRDNVEPSTLGISPERATDIFNRFEKRAIAETDIPSIVDGIIPPELIFDPDIPDQTMQTEAGPAEIRARGRVYGYIVNKFFKFLSGNEAVAYINQHNKRISVFPKLDKFSTVVAVAKGNFENVVGPVLAHEAVHAHQTEKRGLELTQIPEQLKKMKFLRLADPELSQSEAANLVKHSADLTILREAQAHLLSYSITGGTEGVSPEMIAGVKAKLAQFRTGNIKEMDIEDVDRNLLEEIDDEKREQIVQTFDQAEFNDIPLSRYSDNGYASVLDLLVNHTKRYYPVSYQSQEKPISRIRSAALQMMRLLNSGVSHREIAELIWKCQESTTPGSEWDSESGRYTFLQRAIDDHPGQEQIDDTALARKFDKQTVERVTKLRSIAAEELTGKKLEDIQEKTHIKITV